MKNNKRRFLYMALVVVLILGIASTASAAVHYAEDTVTQTSTDETITLITYVRDNNTRCYFCPSATEYTTGYNSQGWKLGASKPFSTKYMSSGGDYRHPYANPQGTKYKGHLGFQNCDQPGQRIFVNGYMS